MRQSFRTGMLVAALGGMFVGAAQAQAQDRVRIGVLNDQSGVFSTKALDNIGAEFDE